MRQAVNKTMSLWGQGGVALADILANSVAMILILIIVTLSVQQEKADLELEKNADITTLLARQIATTVVYNDLPSSPPALLHDYNSCAIPHDCNPALYPVIELRQQYIREYNTGLRFYRKELLKANNPFDQLIQTFNAQERLNLRIDIYDVNLYYLAIGILKEHNISPRHWHYLGEDVKPLISPEEALADGKHGVANQKQEGLGENGKFSENSGKNTQQNDNSSKQGGNSLNDTQLADLQTLEEIQHDSLLPPSDQLSEQGGESEKNGQSDNPSANSGSLGSSGQDKNTQLTPDTMFESMIELFKKDGVLPPDVNANQLGRSGQPNGQGQRTQSSRRGRRSLKMHVPNARSRQRPKRTITLSKEDYYRVLLAFFLDQLQLARTQKTTFIQGLSTIISRYAKDPEMLNSHPDITLINRLDNELKQYFINKPTEHAPLTKIISDAPNQLTLIANQVNTTSTLIVNQADDSWSKNIDPNNAAISLVLRSFPGLYKGQRLDFPPGHLLIVHPNENQYPDMQWRPIIVVDPWLEDASIGFVKAAFSNNKLRLDAQTLGTRLDQNLIPEPKLQDNPESKNISTILYTAIGLLLFVIILIGLTLPMLWQKNTQPNSN